MTENLNIDKHDGVLTIAIEGAFNAKLVQRFREVFIQAETGINRIVIDLAGAEFVDSAALGLLIHLKKRLAQSDVDNIRIINSNARIRRVFKTMKFQDMFDIDMVEP